MKSSGYWYIRLLTGLDIRPLFVGLVTCAAADFHHLGVLDEEIWNANLSGLRGMVSSKLFELTHSRWNDSPPDCFRKSFGELVQSLRSEN